MMDFLKPWLGWFRLFLAEELLNIFFARTPLDKDYLS
jgi:hypothetical protein